eukprot:UN28582
MNEMEPEELLIKETTNVDIVEPTIAIITQEKDNDQGTSGTIVTVEPQIKQNVDPTNETTQKRPIDDQIEDEPPKKRKRVDESLPTEPPVLIETELPVTMTLKPY